MWNFKIPKYWYQQKNAILQISTLSFQTNLLLCQFLNRTPKAVSKFKIKCLVHVEKMVLQMWNKFGDAEHSLAV